MQSFRILPIALSLAFVATTITALPTHSRSDSGSHINCLASAIMDHDDLHQLTKRAVDWSYEGAKGPMYWGSLNPNYTVCATGKTQSPINFEKGAANYSPKSPITFSYPDIFKTAKVANMGYTVELVAPKNEAYITRDGVKYDLVQFHIHSPSEHRLHSSAYAAEIHLVHKSAAGDLHVVGLFIEHKERLKRLGWFQDWIDNVPEEIGLANATTIKDFPIGNIPPLFVQDDTSYWSYEGSLTNPPCTQGVKWVVSEKPFRMRLSQLEEIKALMPFNSRLTQAPKMH